MIFWGLFPVRFSFTSVPITWCVHVVSFKFCVTIDLSENVLSIAKCVILLINNLIVSNRWKFFWEAKAKHKEFSLKTDHPLRKPTLLTATLLLTTASKNTSVYVQIFHLTSLGMSIFIYLLYLFLWFLVIQSSWYCNTYVFPEIILNYFQILM